MNHALAQMILTIVVLICGRKFYIVGFKTLFKGHPNMDSLVAIGTGSAFLYSLVNTFLILSDHMYVENLYYESAAVVVTLVMLGKYMEARSKGKNFRGNTEADGTGSGYSFAGGERTGEGSESFGCEKKGMCFSSGLAAGFHWMAL